MVYIFYTHKNKSRYEKTEKRAKKNKKTLKKYKDIEIFFIFANGIYKEVYIMTQQTKTTFFDKLVDINQLATLTGFKRERLYKMVQRAEIPYYKFGETLRFNVDEIEQWAKAKKIK